MGKLVRHYQSAAVVILNTLVLTAVVLLVLHVLFPLENSVWEQNLGGQRLSDGLVPANYHLTDAATTERIRHTWDDYVLQGHWQVHPWTGLINRRFTSEHLNVAADGRRAGRAPSAEHAGLPPLELWALGGSTLFGWGVSDAHTIPSHLQTILQEQHPERQVRVRNLGVPWYNSSHEVALLLAHLRRAAEASQLPDRVILFDGLNDMVHRVHYHSESPLHHQLDRAWEERLRALFAPPPWIRLAPSFPLFRLASALGSETDSTLGGVEAPRTEGDEQDWIRGAADAYRMNLRVASAICTELGIQPFFLLQPVPMWLNETRDETVDPRYEAFAGQVLAGSESGVSLLDLRGALADLEPRYAMTVEESGVHYSDVAGQVLAAAIADAMARVQSSETSSAGAPESEPESDAASASAKR